MTARDPIKVYDARWEIHEFDDAAVIRLFEATFIYARRLGVDTVTLARDGRLGAAHVLELGMETARRAGLRTIVCADPIGTPASYYLTLRTTREHPATAGLTITASHNPREYIGVKFVMPVVQAIGYDCGPQGGLTAIRTIYHGGERLAAAPPGRVRMVNCVDEYIDFSLRQAGVAPGDLAGLGVVLDGFHGSAGPELMRALELAGASVEPLRILPDGGFPTGSPNPTSQGKMDAAVARARELGCAAAIGLDGDGDRLVFADARGVLSAGFAAVPILRAVAGDLPRGGPIRALYDPKVNPLALAEWGRLGIEPVVFRNGHSQIKDHMRRIGAQAAAEESGHYYHRVSLDGLTVCCENTVMTTLGFLEAVKSRPAQLDELRRMQDEVCTTGEFNYQFEDDAARDRAMRAAIGELSAQGARTATATPEGIDLEGTVLARGVSIAPGDVRLEAGWYSAYIRASTNEKAVVRAYFSCADPDLLARLESQTRRILGQLHAGRIIE